MSDSPTTPVGASGTPAPLRRDLLPPIEPAFGKIVRGLWLFTWRSKLSWRRVPLLLTGMLVLPLLYYLSSMLDREPAGWRQFGNASGRFRSFAHELSGAGLPLKGDQSARLEQSFHQEFGRSLAALAQAAPGDTDSNPEAIEVKACYSRIASRAATILDDNQLARLETFAGRRVVESQENPQRWGQRTAFLYWLVYFYFFIVLPLTCVSASGSIIRDELQADTLGFLLTRPVTRAQLVVARYLAQVAWLQILLLFQTLFIFAAGRLRLIPDLGGFLPLFLATQFLAVFAWSALGLFLGMFSKRHVALALVYGIIVEKGIGSIPTNINTLSLMRHLKSLLSANEAVQNIFSFDRHSVVVSVGALLLATGFFLTLATILFTFREYHHTAEMQK